MITGGDGYLGLQVAKRYLEETEDAVLLWVRADGEEEFAAKKRRVSEQVASFGERVSFGYGNLVRDNAFETVEPEGIWGIIHTAAVTRFNVDEETARRVNVEGTQRLLEFASRCPSIRALGLMSTVYTSGLRAGRIDEVAFDGNEGFANHYEQSKWVAETLLLTRFTHLPWRIFRIATAIADDDSGTVTQQNAFHNTLKILFYGLLSLIPGKRQTPLYFVTGQFVANAVFDLMQRPADNTIYHVAHTRDESLSLGELIDLAFETFMEDEDFKTRRILKPLYSDAETFDLVAEGVSSFGGVVVSQAISSIAPFARQLFVEKDIQNQRLIANMTAYRAPEARQLIRNACEHLVRTRWGRTRHPA